LNTGNYEAHFGKMASLSKAATDDPFRLRRVASTVWRRGTVSGFKRRQKGAWDLLYLALKDAVGDRNG
jgi:hypothetical protein